LGRVDAEGQTLTATGYSPRLLALSLILAFVSLMEYNLRACICLYLFAGGGCAIDLFTVSDVTFVASMHASLHLCLTLLAAAVHAVISVS
jgi:hypothetical protein